MNTGQNGMADPSAQTAYFCHGMQVGNSPQQAYMVYSNMLNPANQQLAIQPVSQTLQPVGFMPFQAVGFVNQGPILNPVANQQIIRQTDSSNQQISVQNVGQQMQDISIQPVNNAEDERMESPSSFTSEFTSTTSQQEEPPVLEAVDASESDEFSDSDEEEEEESEQRTSVSAIDSSASASASPRGSTSASLPPLSPHDILSTEDLSSEDTDGVPEWAVHLAGHVFDKILVEIIFGEHRERRVLEKLNFRIEDHSPRPSTSRPSHRVVTDYYVDIPFRHVQTVKCHCCDSQIAIPRYALHLEKCFYGGNRADNARIQRENGEKDLTELLDEVFAEEAGSDVESTAEESGDEDWSERSRRKKKRARRSKKSNPRSSAPPP